MFLIESISLCPPALLPVSIFSAEGAYQTGLF